MPMYIATAIVLQKEKELLAEEEQEVCAIFSILSKVGKSCCPWYVWYIFFYQILALFIFWFHINIHNCLFDVSVFSYFVVT